MKTLIGIFLVFAAAGVSRSQKLAPSPEIEIVSAPSRFSFSELSRDIGRPFGKISCKALKAPETLSQALGRVKRIVIQHYELRNWPDVAAVAGYIRRVLEAIPEGRAVASSVYWAEGRTPEIKTTLEFPDGGRGRMDLANGYAHAVSASGCEWWARYLGPDRSGWVVRPF